MLTVEERVFLDQMRLKHLPGLHDQSTHGHRGHGVRDVLMAARHVGQLAQASKKEAKRITGRDVSFRFRGCSLAVSREHAEGILTGLEHFPNAPLKEVTTYGPGGARREMDVPMAAFGAYAVAMPGRYSEPSDVIMFNTRLAGEDRYYRASLKRDKESGHSTTDDPMGVALHEFGHVVDHYGNAHGQIFTHLRRPGVAEKRISKMARDGVSAYAATDLHELTAEAFSDVMANGDDASPLSRELFSVIEDAYRTRARADAWRNGEVQP